ncbi:MAG: deoxynucleoside kinase [Planctomycetota bacterium]|nr:deoxynucleoside kinase [Planctomycetota bacterium]
MPSLDSLKLIAIDGPPAIGKSKLASDLARHLDARLILDGEENPFLQQFFQDMEKYALHTQISFLLSRYKQQSEIAQPELFHRLTITDYTLATDEIFAVQTLSHDEHRLYLHLKSALVDKFVTPDLVLFLQATPETVSNRLDAGEEKPPVQMDSKYVARVVNAYNSFFKHFDEAPVLTVDVNETDVNSRGIDLESLVEVITSMDGSNAHFKPARSSV